ncbi:MAG: hypothetical protein HKN39_04680 [Flavobacteriales bacterium]|nr:hypothetical protein [Flavobacteriales bacterium]
MLVLKKLITTILIMGSIFVNAQIDPIFISTMPSEVDESSGLSFTGPNSIWTHNDTDNDALIFNIDLNGTFLEEIELSDVIPVDFEDVAFDGLINFYIADLGNNLNDRMDLKIYKIPNPDLLDNSIFPEVIEVTLSDQSQFPPSDEDKNFDIEAMIYFNDALHLFSRNRTNPFNGIIKHYKLDPTPGTQAAELQGTYFGNLSENHSGITGADISPDGSRLVLLSNAALFTFTQFEGDNFFGGTQTYNFFSNNTSKEGVCFIDNCMIRIGEESSANGDPGNFYSLNTCDIISSLSELDVETTFKVQVSGQLIRITSTFGEFTSKLFSIDGKLVHNGSSSDRSMIIDLGNCARSSYILSLENDTAFPSYFKVSNY